MLELDLVGTVFAGMVVAVILAVTPNALTERRGLRIFIAAVLGAWLGIDIVISATGGFLGSTAGPITLLVSFATPLVVAALLAALSPQVRSALLSIPMPFVIGINAIRSAGVFFLLLAAVGRLAGPFPYSAGFGDILTGTFALPVAWLALRRPDRRGLIAAWNVFGTLDLIVAVCLGVFSTEGSVVQLIHAGVGAQAVSQLPWSLIPTFLVPYFMITHAIVFAQLRSRAGETARAVKGGTISALAL